MVLSGQSRKGRARRVYVLLLRGWWTKEEESGIRCCSAQGKYQRCSLGSFPMLLSDVIYSRIYINCPHVISSTYFSAAYRAQQRSDSLNPFARNDVRPVRFDLFNAVTVTPSSAASSCPLVLLTTQRYRISPVTRPIVRDVQMCMAA
ncbi:uncharacterized protein FOMMEDRAFT_169581 [Fomitiporia mediterranea MF3/22]|uniref:uncharacterized protein n=1 Tax=Fomitiporia mediterranea (strain MF3/22) TaxID=694068 RepID=UPI0004408C96|nr:uncharacterized protein FOMMEDRAFT_169581 [Fomitiporia mediterranea MF3/22]EJD01466.1 hypothetical protein FOMMEDRAFT_169581 [Fomitiporia mediterranea MF3/22]